MTVSCPSTTRSRRTSHRWRAAVLRCHPDRQPSGQSDELQAENRKVLSRLESLEAPNGTRLPKGSERERVLHELPTYITARAEADEIERLLGVMHLHNEQASTATRDPRGEMMTVD